MELLFTILTELEREMRGSLFYRIKREKVLLQNRGSTENFYSFCYCNPEEKREKNKRGKFGFASIDFGSI
jgi:hypothetical protein